MSKPWQDMTDREHDALVAEKVMGWQRVESPGMRMTLLMPGVMAQAGYSIRMAASWDRIGDVSVPVATLSKTVKESGLEWLWRKHARDTLPHYSTDIAAAWAVVEQLHAQHIRVAVIAYLDGNHRCELRGQGTEFLLAKEGPTAPAAICLAALKAVGYEGV